MRLIANSAKGRHRIRQKLRRIALAAVAIGCLIGGLAGAAAAVAPMPAQAATTMSLAQFVSTYSGQKVNYPAVHSGLQYQCVDLFKLYDVKVVGGTGPAPAYPYGADQYWYNFTGSIAAHYTKIAPTAPAQPGDVAVWNGGLDGYGHIAIVLSSAAANPVSSTSPLYVLSQNPGPVEPGTEYKTQNYEGVETLLGFLRPTKSATQPTPTSSQPPAPYHTGRQVKIEPNATTGVSGHTGPGNKYASNKATRANQPLWIVCYVTGQSITNSSVEDTTKIWDLSDNGYYYTDAWLNTGSYAAVVPACHLKHVTVDKYATGGLSGHTGPGNNYTAGPVHRANTPITIACYVTGQSIRNSHYNDTTTIWDLAVGGHYYSDAWLYTGTNGAAVPHC